MRMNALGNNAKPRHLLGKLKAGSKSIVVSHIFDTTQILEIKYAPGGNRTRA